MNSPYLFHPVERTRQAVRDTIAKPLSLARRPVRWLMAAGLALASVMPAGAQVERADPPELKLEKPGRLEHSRGEVRPFFEKIGRQADCDHVTYRLRFGLRGDPGTLFNPAFADELKTLRMDLSDQLPNGLTVINVQASGDGTDAVGGLLPAATIGTTADPNDTAELKDFRLSASDLDGSGEVGERYVEVRIVAKIDHAAFPAPTPVDNQGWVNIQLPAGGTIYVPSHDPALPDDGDFLTGEKTRISIDVTDCEPPPPPPPGDRQPCFKIEQGEVDCVPGGGAFVYHMPFGAQMGGKVVQLKTTTPGITIAPLSQVVPAGGGVLDWTITGAAPGEAIHLLVVGVETYAGPEEGVGLCCTQTIDLVIPEDLNCPEREHEPDLKVDKRAEVPHCTKAGGCNFTIRVTNVGDEPYNGKIVLDEVTLPGNASIDSGPNAPWTCAPATSPMSCEYPATTLDPGEVVELKLGFKPGPGWNWSAIRNCAEYDYAASGKGPFGDLTNDKACASIPICVPGRDRECTPPELKKVDLTIRKRAETPVCSLDGVCIFIIDIINSGTETINGPLTVVDNYPSGVPASSDFEPTPPWTCVPDGVGQFRCDHPGIMLVPGASTAISVKAVAGADFPGSLIENCAEVQPVPGETNLANNRSCAKARLPNREPGKPGAVIKVEKTGERECRAGQPCTFEITIRNDSSEPFHGAVRIGDAVELEGLGRLEGVPITAIEPPFGCSPEPATLPISCDADLSLGAGEARVHRVTIVIPKDALADQTGQVAGRNCVAVLEPGTLVRGGGLTIGRSPGVEPSADGRYACHAFALSKEEVKQECSRGFVMNDAGRCVCPEGTTFRNGQCSGGGRTPPQPEPEPKLCKLLPGQIRTQDGRCICPRGTQLGGQGCVKIERPPVPECKLLPGQIRTKEGKCVCPRGTQLGDQGCVKIEQPPVPECKLLPGQIRTKEGRCVCPRGTTLERGECRRGQVECPKGTVQIRGRCLERIEPVCRSGQVLRNGRCIDIVEPRCPRGTLGTRPNCAHIRLREPTLQINPNVSPNILRTLPPPSRQPSGNPALLQQQ